MTETGLPKKGSPHHGGAFLFSLFLLVFLFRFLPVLFSQTPPPGSKVGPEEEAFRKHKRELAPERKPLIDYEVEEIPSGAIVETSFFVREIVVEGETPLKPSEIKKVLSPYENKTLTLSGLREASRALTVAIRSRGFVTSRIYVPPQKVEEGVVHFSVLEGKLGKISVQGNKRFKEKFVKRLLKARSGQILRYDRLEQDLLRLNTHPDREVRAVLLPGEAPETSDLMLQVKETFPVHLGYSFDNFGTRLTGRLRHGISFTHTNLLGLEDILQSRFLLTDGGHFAGLSVDYLLPLTASTDLAFDYTFVDTRLGKELDDSKIRGKANIYSVTFLQRVIDYDRLEGSAYLGFDFKEIETTEDRRPNSRDNLRILRLGPQLVERDKSGRTFFTSEFAFAFSGFLGASDKVDRNSSRTEAGGQFFRSVLEFGRLQKLPYEMFLLQRLAAHLTPDKLPASEQMRVGGAETVRGYPEGDFLGERGLNISTELRFPCYLIPRAWRLPKSEVFVRDSLQLLSFFDLARVETKGAPDLQNSNRTLAGLGMGLRLNLSRKIIGRNLSARLDWGWPVGDRPSSSGKRRPRFHFSLSVSF